MNNTILEAPPLTKEQAIIITAFTKIVCCPFSEFHEAVEERLGRPVYTHEFGDKSMSAKIKEAFREDFLRIALK
jgi:hypothetical protein